MLKIWVLYNLLLLGAIFGTSIASVGADLRVRPSLSQFFLPLLLLPLLYYLGKELMRKPKRRKIVSPTVFASSTPASVTTIQPEGNAPTLEEGEVVRIPGVNDTDRRLFLRLIGTSSLSILFMVLLGKKSAHAAFFGSVPGPGTVAIKNIAGDQIDPVEAQPTDGYTISEVDDSGTTSYYGFVHKNGAWYITKEDATGSYRYAKGASAFSTSWTIRGGLSYDYFDNVF